MHSKAANDAERTAVADMPPQYWQRHMPARAATRPSDRYAQVLGA
ncbi:hypothetical protein SMD11_1617 [Streptomyces albireticuli]|uniref:Uncharacterized protein n=1 Tax=Streptomyces albireticuli TaxID=1940 RepID=A0A1Z2KZ04_9ACTN|nr:hypothetical protein SMD11_1617 [Streptomyces albireticuli]